MMEKKKGNGCCTIAESATVIAQPLDEPFNFFSFFFTTTTNRSRPHCIPLANPFNKNNKEKKKIEKAREGKRIPRKKSAVATKTS